MAVTFGLGVFTSHMYRAVILRLDWLKLSIAQLIPRVIVACILFGAAFLLLHTIISDIIIAGEWPQMEWLEILQLLINLSGMFMIWSLLYFLFHFIENYKKEEIKNLKWQAAKNEIELNKLKSQLNPHFIFNSMNIIRALVDENPQKSKDSITRLSNILRSSLLMGRKEVIPFKEEMQLVNDYLGLEKTRFEERLEVQMNIESDCMEMMVPPMMVQTLVENGIKHGISQLPQGGRLSIMAYKKDDLLVVQIENDGRMKEVEFQSGFGLKNTKQRLQLLYGEEASFHISNKETKVLAVLKIPSKNIKYIQNDYESNNN